MIHIQTIRHCPLRKALNVYAVQTQWTQSTLTGFIVSLLLPCRSRSRWRAVLPVCRFFFFKKKHHPYIRAGVSEHCLYSQNSSSRSITLPCSNTDTQCAAVSGAKSPQFERAVCEQVYTLLKKKSTGGPQSSWMKSATSSQGLPTLFICLKWRVCTRKIPITTNKVPQTRVTH